MEYKNSPSARRYVEFIFKRQFRRKIAPGLFILTKPSLIAVLVGVAAYMYVPEKYSSYVIVVVGVYLARNYTKTRMTYRGKNTEWEKGREDESVFLLSVFAAKKEFYLKNSITVKRGEEL